VISKGLRSDWPLVKWKHFLITKEPVCYDRPKKIASAAVFEKMHAVDQPAILKTRSSQPVAPASEVVQVVRGCRGGPHGLPHLVGCGPGGAHQLALEGGGGEGVLVVAEDEGLRRRHAGQGGHHKALQHIWMQWVR